MYEYRARVTNVVDGDTIDVDIDLGLEVHLVERVRVYGVNAPEMHAPDPAPGEAAKRYVEAQLPVGTGVVLQTVKPTDKYGRYLAIVLYDDASSVRQNLATNLIAAGHGVAYFGGPRI